MVLILQLVPPLNALILVLQTLIPVFQALALGRDAKLAATCQSRKKRHSGGESRDPWAPSEFQVPQLVAWGILCSVTWTCPTLQSLYSLLMPRIYFALSCTINAHFLEPSPDHHHDSEVHSPCLSTPCREPLIPKPQSCPPTSVLLHSTLPWLMLSPPCLERRRACRNSLLSLAEV